MIDWQNFTPLSALSGGLLIGVAVAILLFFKVIRSFTVVIPV